MEVLFSNKVATPLVCIFTITFLWKVMNWVWLKPKRLEKRLTKQGFRVHSYTTLYGDTKEIAEMVKETTSRPMDHFSNDYIARILPFHHQIIKTHGEKSFIWDGPTPMVIITKPEEMREIMLKIYNFRKRIPNPVMKRLTNGLLRLEGQKWASERKLLNPAFHVEKLKHMLPAFYTSCSEMIIEWEKMGFETGSIEVEMWSFLHNLSADAISRAAFGSSFRDGRRLFELLREHISISAQAMKLVYIPGSWFLPTKANKREAKITKEMECLLKEMIQSRLIAMKDGEEAKDDLLGLLLKSNLEGLLIDSNNRHEDHNKQQHFKLNMKEVIEECKMFYIAGQETTSSLLVWTLVLLSKHRDWQEQAREEILTVFGHETPHFDGLNQLKKVNMILHEVLRLYPPGSTLARKVHQDIRVGNVVLPASVNVLLPTVFIHHSEKFWGPDAKEFNPERFSNGISKATGGNMCFFAFGWGPRICIGSNFAMMEAKIALSMILQRFTLELSPSYAHAPTISHGTLRPQFGAKLILRRI